MKPVIGEAISAEDKVRKSLHELQPSAINKETLVGADRMIKSTPQVKEAKSKQNAPTKIKKDASKQKKQKKVTTNDKAIQSEPEGKITIEAEDLTCTNLAGPSENYWQLTAEKLRIALKDTLEENKDLANRVKKLEEDNRIYKEMLDETRALVEVLQDMIGDDRNGIDNSLEDSDRNGINNSLDDSAL